MLNIFTVNNHSTIRSDIRLRDINNRCVIGCDIMITFSFSEQDRGVFAFVLEYDATSSTLATLETPAEVHLVMAFCLLV